MRSHKFKAMAAAAALLLASGTAVAQTLPAYTGAAVALQTADDDDDDGVAGGMKTAGTIALVVVGLLAFGLLIADSDEGDPISPN